MPLFDRLYELGPVRKALWRHWYPLLTWLLQREDVIFLNYALESKDLTLPPLSESDAPNQAHIQLYQFVASLGNLAGQEVLEVSCGHGGGSSFLHRQYQARRWIGLDFNPRGIQFCRRRHQVSGLSFVQGDAEALPFPAASFDVVLNIEASHCYGNFEQFLLEAARVLRPGGELLYADFRDQASLAAWKAAFAGAPFQQLAFVDISAEVARGMERNAGRSAELVRRYIPPFLRSLGGDFAGLPGSRIHRALEAGELFYKAGRFRKLSSPLEEVVLPVHSGSAAPAPQVFPA